MEKLLVWVIEKYPSVRFTRKFAPQNFKYNNLDIRSCNRNGINYKLYIQDYQSWLLYFDCDYDSSFEVLKFAKKGDTVIDVGGNIGQTAMMFSKTVGKDGKIISFEPYYKTFECFKENLSLNKDLENIKIENLGLGEKKETLGMLEECTTNSGGNRITTSNSDQNIHLIQVEIMSLDEYYEEHKLFISKIDLIKIDVEGFEMKVLNGAKKILNAFHPKLFIEIDDTNLKKQGDTAQSMLDFLLLQGYDIFDVSNTKKITQYIEMNPLSRDIYCKPKLMA
jgi:FkbM family methyltransferase